MTAAIQGLAGGNIDQAIVGASAPYLAGVIKDSTGDNLEARIMAHALLGAVLAKSQQNSALAGAAGASIGELVASQLYPGKSSDQLTEAEKQKVSALSTLAGGLAGGLVGGSSADAIAGAQASKNAVENNYLSVEEASVKKTLTLKEREGTITPEEAQKLEDTKKLDKDRDATIQAACTVGNKAGVECGRLVAMAKQALVEYGDSVSYSLLYKDIYPEDSANVEAVLQGLDTESIIRDVAITAIVKESGLSRGEIESRYDLVMSLQAVTAALAGVYGVRSLAAEAPSTSKGIGSKVDGAKATSIEFLPKATRNSAGQIEANITQSSAIKTLESNGYRKTISQDGSVTVLTNGEKTYRFYPSSTSTGQPSASLTIEGVKKPTAKIRFSGE
ncbi:VENN motif pre-toxin domain-containing protein [Pseudomonas mohnii]